MNWQDEMPAIPLARGVPVVRRRDEPHPGVRCIVTKESTGGFWFTTGSQYLAKASTVVVDLDDPQGFGYALRLLWPNVSRLPTALVLSVAWLWDEVVERHLAGKTTDNDRIALARALDEVTP